MGRKSDLTAITRRPCSTPRKPMTDVRHLEPRVFVRRPGRPHLSASVEISEFLARRPTIPSSMRNGPHGHSFIDEAWVVVAFSALTAFYYFVPELEITGCLCWSGSLDMRPLIKADTSSRIRVAMGGFALTSEPARQTCRRPTLQVSVPLTPASRWAARPIGPSAKGR